MEATSYIKVSLDSELTISSDLFFLLEQLFPVKFIFDEQHGIKIAGEIISGISTHNIREHIPTLSLLSPIEPVNESQLMVTDILFSDISEAPFPFRGRSLRAKISKSRVILSAENNEKILARTEDGPLWKVSEAQGIKHFSSGLALPFITGKTGFNDVFNGDCFLEMMVLLEFIRAINSVCNYQNAQLRACFIIDDPNLHWPRYGFFDYREIVDIATKENFHMSFATIPLDNWFTHRATVDIFRKNKSRISLLIHGNNHAKKELGLEYTDEARDALLLQAINRIEKLEANTNLQVSRVMVPPHGACSNDMLGAMPQCGFESACISSGSLRFHNPERPWVKTLGFFPSEIIEGCPVLPRWGLTGNVENTLLAAAYLGQPLILRGHHQDLKGGGSNFIDFARFINSLGSVVWSNMEDLSRLSYQWRMEGTTVWIKPFSRKVIINLPEKATEIIINPGKLGDLSWQITSSNGVYQINPNESFVLLGLKESEITIQQNSRHPTKRIGSKSNPTPLKLWLRRLLTETRDRMLLS